MLSLAIEAYAAVVAETSKRPVGVWTEYREHLFEGTHREFHLSGIDAVLESLLRISVVHEDQRKEMDVSSEIKSCPASVTM